MELRQNVGILIQARLSSTRLPGKIALPLLGKPLILWIVDQMRRCKNAQIVGVLTSDSGDNDRFIEILKKMQIPHYIGSDSDVLSRYYRGAEHFKLRHVVRITADNPFISSEIIDFLIAQHLVSNADFTYIKNVPIGIGLGMGVMSFSCLERVNNRAKKSFDREHVVTYILDNADDFTINVVTLENDLSVPEYRFTVDYEEDYILAIMIFSKLKQMNKLNTFTLRDVISLVKKDKTVYNLMLKCIKRSKRR